MSFIQLNQKILNLLRCAHCKGPLRKQEKAFVCDSCFSSYPAILVDTGSSKETIFDFRIHHPSFALPPGMQNWENAQQKYEDYSHHHNTLDDLEFYLKEIDSVQEIYTKEFSLSGSILDVGGHQGRLRHFLQEADEDHYVSIDPMPEVFSQIEKNKHLLKAYPRLRHSCNFVSAFSENLPFKNKSFDWVHMRSVMDHFHDPYFALKEAYRVIKPGGHLLVGLLITEKIQHPAQVPVQQLVYEKLKKDGLYNLLKAAINKIAAPNTTHEEDEHIFRFKHQELNRLLEATGFGLEKEHWQKPPNTAVIYLSCKKLPTQNVEK